MKTILRALRRSAAWVANWHELLGIPIGLALFAGLALLVRWADPTSAIYDWAVFQPIAFALATFMFAKGTAWLILRLDFPDLYRLLDGLLAQWAKTRSGLHAALILYGLHLILITALMLALL